MNFKVRQISKVIGQFFSISEGGFYSEAPNEPP